MEHTRTTGTMWRCAIEARTSREKQSASQLPACITFVEEALDREIEELEQTPRRREEDPQKR